MSDAPTGPEEPAAPEWSVEAGHVHRLLPRTRCRPKMTISRAGETVDACEILHQLMVNIPLFVVFHPSFWWCRISSIHSRKASKLSWFWFETLGSVWLPRAISSIFVMIFWQQSRFNEKGGKLGNDGGNIIELTSWKDSSILFLGFLKYNRGSHWSIVFSLFVLLFSCFKQYSYIYLYNTMVRL